MNPAVPHWTNVVASWAWLVAALELDLLLWIGIVRGVEALVS